MSRRWALIAGGGTGGHLMPAVALARMLAEGDPSSVEIVGSRRGIDAQVLSECGLPVTLLTGRGLRRRLHPADLARNVVALSGLAWAAAVALVLVARRRPAVVVAMGGYASVPVTLSAFFWRVPVVLVNVDAVPGAANRLVGRFAAAVAVAFPGTPLERSVVTGAPVRAEIAAAAVADDDARMAARTEARRRLGLPVDRTAVMAVGGSLGARRLNEAVMSLALMWHQRDDVALYQVAGWRDFPDVEAAAPRGSSLWYRPVEFEADMASFYQAADVVVCRSGANTVAELAVVGVAAVLVPLPGAPGDHQTANATVLVEAGAAVMLRDEQCTGTELDSTLRALIDEPGRLTSMGAAARKLGRPHALEAVAELVRAHARPGVTRR
ncbi:MAG: UDP-N-acetylglucosamine--N-acetylmuramyl-(pentapeptide) pyrophosphoryl-undecaprenol N-acetylglucosamine transferase [Acidimicrobiales bacterium]